MKYILSREEMRELDRCAIEDHKIPGLILMENAGRGATDFLASLRSLQDLSVVVVCGPGNNGGDGFVIARHLLTRHAKPHVFLCVMSEKLTGDARINLDAYLHLGGTLSYVLDTQDLESLQDALKDADFIVDTLFGTGLCRPIQGIYIDIIEVMNRVSCTKVSIDLPSGMDANTGEPLGHSIHADHTITLGHLKSGFFATTKVDLTGKVHVTDLGIPDHLLQYSGYTGQLLEEETIRRWLIPRGRDTHKYKEGGVLVLAGSRGKIGAALLTARAVLRGGAGLCTIATWPESLDAIQGNIPEIMTTCLDPKQIVYSLEELLPRQRVVIMGPGFGLEEHARCAVEYVLRHWRGIKIVDADALTLFAGNTKVFADAEDATILTPHTGELGRLLGLSTTEIEQNRIAAAQNAAIQTKCTVLLKGPNTLITRVDQGTKSDPSKGRQPTLWVNPTGNPALAIAGSGDTLAGLIGALACSLEPVKAAAAGAFIHGLAADRWQAQHRSDRGLFASEISDLFPSLLGELTRLH